MKTILKEKKEEITTSIIKGLEDIKKGKFKSWKTK